MPPQYPQLPISLRQHSAVPLLAGEREVGGDRQPLAAAPFVVKHDVERSQHRAILGCGVQFEGARQPEQCLAMAVVEAPQERGVVVAARGGDQRARIAE
jgi:hypothetical protein